MVCVHYSSAGKETLTDVPPRVTSIYHILQEQVLLNGIRTASPSKYLIHSIINFLLQVCGYIEVAYRASSTFTLGITSRSLHAMVLSSRLEPSHLNHLD